MITKHLVRNYDRISQELGRVLANTYFGDRIYASLGGNDQKIIPFEDVTGDTHPDDHAELPLGGELTEQGKKAYMQTPSNGVPHHPHSEEHLRPSKSVPSNQQIPFSMDIYYHRRGI